MTTDELIKVITVTSDKKLSIHDWANLTRAHDIWLNRCTIKFSNVENHDVHLREVIKKHLLASYEVAVLTGEVKPLKTSSGAADIQRHPPSIDIY